MNILPGLLVLAAASCAAPQVQTTRDLAARHSLASQEIDLTGQDPAVRSRMADLLRRIPDASPHPAAGDAADQANADPADQDASDQHADVPAGPVDPSQAAEFASRFAAAAGQAGFTAAESSQSTRPTPADRAAGRAAPSAHGQPQFLPAPIWRDPQAAADHQPQPGEQALFPTPPTDVRSTPSTSDAHASHGADAVQQVQFEATGSSGQSPWRAAPAVHDPNAGRPGPSDQQMRVIVHELRAMVAAGDDEPAVRAAKLAALSMLDPQAGPGPDLLEQLTPTQRRHIEGYRQLVQVAAERIAAAQGPVDRNAIIEQVAQTLGPAPITIRDMRLCSRVRGFGIYDELSHESLLAGRRHRMILYVELDNFRVREYENQFEVSLSQEVVLYNESDGLAVWRQPATEILDRSRNRRRDFFIVQLIELPATLSVGKYQLKARVTDREGGSIDEAVVPIHIVAETSLVTAEGRAATR